MNSVKNNLHLGKQLSPSDWLILVESWSMLLFFHLALRWASFEHLKNSPRLISSEIPDPPGVLLFAQKYHHLVGWASSLHLLPMTCLSQSLALYWMLNRRGVPAQIRIGVKKSLDRIHAHAWIDVLGETIGEAEDIPDRFTALESPAEYKKSS